MRKLSHLKPRYIFKRIVDIIYQVNNPTHPWLTPKSIRLLETLLNKEDIGLEFGSGRSTIWFSKKTSHITSIETSESWYKKIKSDITSLNIDNANLIYIPTGDVDIDSYTSITKQFSDNSLDYVLVDGRHRDYCIMSAIGKIKPGGLLIIDNVNRYLRSNSFSPSSIAIDKSLSSELWGLIEVELCSWRNIWTSNGVTDTAIYIKKL